MKHSPHNGNNPKSNKILKVIHSNISKPYNSSINDKKYFITFLDEYSWKVRLFTLKSKAEAPDIINDFLKYLNNQFEDHKVKIFKTDGGKEYKNKKIRRYCKDNGIEKSFSPPYCPENNGKAERINQTIKNTAKIFIILGKII